MPRDAKPTPKWIRALPFPMRPIEFPSEGWWLGRSVVTSDAERYGHPREYERHHFPTDMHSNSPNSSQTRQISRSGPTIGPRSAEFARSA